MRPNHFAVEVMDRFGSDIQEVSKRSSATSCTEEEYHASSGYSLPTLYFCALYWRFMHLSHSFIVHLLIALCFITTDASLYPPVIIGDSDFHEYKGQQYVEKKAGEILELKCSAMEAVKWILPDNSLHAGFDPEEVRFFLLPRKRQHSFFLPQMLDRFYYSKPKLIE